MATKFLKAQNGGIYKDSTGKPIAVEPERVIRDIDSSIPASALEEISVSTATASTNGVTYIRATMKGEVTYTDNTHDKINFDIELPIKAGDGVTIEAQPIAGGTGNKQLVISASGSGGGATLNKYSVDLYTGNATRITLLNNIIKNAKRVVANIYVSINSANYMFPVTFGNTYGGGVTMSGLRVRTDSIDVLYWETNVTDGYVCLAQGTSELVPTHHTIPFGTARHRIYLSYWNETEITE